MNDFKVHKKNITTYVLIDGDEKEFRHGFESFMHFKAKVPVILMLIQGDYSALEEILKAVERRIPILILEVS